VAFADRIACAIVEDLSRRGWTVCIPAVTLAEVITGRPKTDAAVERLVQRIGNTVDCGEALAKAAGALRTKSRLTGEALPSGIDAIVAAVAVGYQPSILLTTDEGDMSRLLASAPSAKVIGV
jgi:predicted nucleic acid-binding protein